MTVELQARHFELTPTVKDYVEKRLERVERYLPAIHATRVELQRDMTRSQGEVYVAEITTWVDQAVLRSEEQNPDLYAAVDASVDKLFRQIEKYKGKRKDRWHGRAETAPIDEEEEEPTEVVRRKKFRVFAMSEDEAMEQLGLLGHDFFLYKDADSGSMNVVYRRKDGGFGIIEPVHA
jgi:putative sigma-54 modulation protein